MKKHILALCLLATSAFLVSFTVYTGTTPYGGKCTGSKYCSACKNCTGCKHCAKEGGRCGVCK